MHFRTSFQNDTCDIILDMPRKNGATRYVLLQFDRHEDNPASNQEMMKEHWKEARKRKAPICDGGDFFCAMQGKYDKRSSKSSLRPEHQEGNYLDTLVYTADELLAPWADLFAFMGPGNHETAILNRHETNLTERLVTMMRARGSQVQKHRYNGFTRFKFMEGSKRYATRLMYHTHGYGGGGPVTKDLIQANRQLAFLDGVDIMCSGHTHDAWVVPQQRVTIDNHGSIRYKETLMIKVPSAKQKFGQDSWEDGKGMPPKPQGAYWLKFQWLSKFKDIVVDAERAW